VGVFLRNHDELTLEMVSEEERQALYGWYAYDPRMRVNVGIRRRLAPLLDNSHQELQLAHALLLSLPGSPFLYYGDEIGMGDNIWLEDRDSSRTPMQWTPDRNAGFSDADPGKLYLPVIQSLAFHYSSSNVETQLAQGTSLLHWVRNLVHLRKEHPVFGVGSLTVVRTDNASVLAFLRDMPIDDCKPGRISRDAPVCLLLCPPTPLGHAELARVFSSKQSDRNHGWRKFPGARRKRGPGAHLAATELLLALAGRNKSVGGLT